MLRANLEYLEVSESGMHSREGGRTLARWGDHCVAAASDADAAAAKAASRESRGPSTSSSRQPPHVARDPREFGETALTETACLLAG